MLMAKKREDAYLMQRYGSNGHCFIIKTDSNDDFLRNLTFKELLYITDYPIFIYFKMKYPFSHLNYIVRKCSLRNVKSIMISKYCYNVLI